MSDDAIEQVEGRTAADVMHRRLSSLPAGTTVGETRAWFAASASRRLATFEDADGRYAGALGPADLPAGAAPETPAVSLAADVPTVSSTTPAADARDLALAQPSQRVPVIDADGRMVGVVAIDKTRTRFCGVA